MYLDYGDKELLPITKNLFFEKIINTARYSPAVVLEFFIRHKAKVIIAAKNATYSSNIGKYEVNLSINTLTNLIDKISYLSYDELYGDVKTTYIYSSYITNNELTYPSTIRIEKTNGKVIDAVKILTAKIIDNDIKLLEKPDGYELTEPEK